jgi:CRP-like cAMP-binding protein
VIFGLLKSTAMSPRLQRLKDTALFGSLTALELRIVQGLMHERRYLPQEIVFDEGEEGQALYLVMSGHVLITRMRSDGSQLEFELAPGSFFGDMALLDSSPRSAQARAVDECELAVFFRDDFLNLMKTDTVIGYKLSLAMARHLGKRLRDLIHGGRPQVEAL